MKQHLSHTPGPIGVFDSGYGLVIWSKTKSGEKWLRELYAGI